MELGAFCAQAPVQSQLGLFLLKATCCQLEAAVAHRQCWQTLPWCGRGPARRGRTGGPAPFSVPGQAGAAWAVLSLLSFGAAFLCPGLRLEPGPLGGVWAEQPGLCCRTRAAQLLDFPREPGAPVRVVVRLWEEQGCRMCSPHPPAHGDLPSILVPSTQEPCCG